MNVDRAEYHSSVCYTARRLARRSGGGHCAGSLRRTRSSPLLVHLTRWQPRRTIARTCFEGPFGAVKDAKSNQPQATDRTWAGFPARSFRKACRARFRSYHPLNSLLPARARTCFEGPFGEVIRATGPMAKANPFRFSTKYQDDETDLLYYGYRYYSLSMGRWLSRDPIGERGGRNLCGFAGNNAIGNIDALGKLCISVCDLAKSMRLDIDPDSGVADGGGVVCCEGKKYTCVWSTGSLKGAAKRALADCMAGHEFRHVLWDTPDCPQCSMVPTRPRTKPSRDFVVAECLAFSESVSCLKKALDGGVCDGDPNPSCKTDLERAVAFYAVRRDVLCGLRLH